MKNKWEEINLDGLMSLKLPEKAISNCDQIRTFKEKGSIGAKGEDNTIRLFNKIVQEGYVVVDAGACIGLYSLLAGNKGCEVLAYEPNNKYQYILEQNMKNYDNISLKNKALFNDNKKVKFCMTPKIGCGYISEQEGLEEVQAVRLDSEISEIDILKVDVEGQDFEVIEGAKELLNNTKFIFVELHTQKEQKNTSNMKLLLLLQEYNFNLLYIDNSLEKYCSLESSIVKEEEQPRILAYKNLLKKEQKNLQDALKNK